MISLRFCLVLLLTSALPGWGCGGGSDGGAEDGAVSICPPGPCDLVAQDCADEAHGCYFAETTGGDGPEPLCIGAGEGEEGDPCMLANDCVAGLLCIGPTGDMGTCRGACCLGADDGCASGLECLIPISAPGASDTGVGACAVPDECDLVLQDCEGAAACYPSVKEGVSVCVAGGEHGEGDPCEFANDCTGGFACTDGECTRLCDRSEGAEDGCEDGQTCVELIGFPSTVGVCDPPL
jgi:hypothetical protein